MDEHLLTVLRYVERNPRRARLVQRVERWLWSSARFWAEPDDRPSFLQAGLVARPEDWLGWVNRPVTAGDLEALRRGVNRGTPFGKAAGIIARTKKQWQAANSAEELEGDIEK